MSYKKKKKSHSSSAGLAGFKDAFAESCPLAVETHVEYRALIEWREGTPHLVSAPVRLSGDPKDTIPTLLRLALDLPYSGKDQTLQGLSNGEAMAVSVARQAAEGDSDAVETILDRTVGKPPQTIKSVALTGDINNFLDRVSQQEFKATIDVVIQTPQEQAEDI